MAARLVGSYQILSCESFGVQNHISVTTDGDGVATGATINLPTAGGRRAGWGMDSTATFADDADSDADSE